MKNVLSKMIAQLSDEDKVLFSKLAEKLDEVDGEISKLTKEEFELIAQMESKYGDRLSQFESEISVEEEVDPSSTTEISGELLETSFAAYARQILARDLKSQFPNEDDAVKFAYQNKWIPQEFKDPKITAQTFEDFKQDICEANQWREEIVGVESDKSMAVGMTWFMVVFQLNQRLN